MARVKNPMVGLASYLIFFLVAIIVSRNQLVPFSNSFWLLFSLLLVTTSLLIFEQHEVLRSQWQRLTWRSGLTLLFVAALVALLLYTVPRIIFEANESFRSTNLSSSQLPNTPAWVLTALGYNLMSGLAMVIAILVVPGEFTDSARDWRYLLPILICIVSAPLENLVLQLIVTVTLWLGLFLSYRASHNFLMPLFVWIIYQLLCDFLPVASINI